MTWQCPKCKSVYDEYSAHIAKRVQMNAVTLRKLVKKEGLQVVSARPNRGR